MAGTISASEWRRVTGFALVVMLVTTIPYLIGWLAQGDDWEFGGFLFGVEDGYSYLAKMRLGMRGEWLFTLRYTAEPHNGALLFLPYLWLGQVAALFVDPHSPDSTMALAVTFHVARVVFGVLLILVSYRFAAFFLPGIRSRWLALILITLGGGLGWLLSLVGRGRWLGSLPLDFFVPESYSFLILFGLPHLALARTAMLLGFLLLFRADLTPRSPPMAPSTRDSGADRLKINLENSKPVVKKAEARRAVPGDVPYPPDPLSSPRRERGRLTPLSTTWGEAGDGGGNRGDIPPFPPRREMGDRWKWSVQAGLCWLVMGLCVPFYIAVVYAILGAWGAAVWWHGRRFPWALFWRALVAALIVLPLLIYTGIVFITNDAMGQWSAQNRLPSPHPLHYLFGYVVLAIPAALALRWARRRGEAPHLLLVAWVVIVPGLVYLPINVQRRLAEGVIVPLSILAAAGLRLAVPRRTAWRRARAGVLLLALPTAFLLWLGGTFSAHKPARPLFHPRAELAALDRLNASVPPDSVVLSSFETGNYLPARTDLIAYIGHGPETLHGKEKRRLVSRFFAGELDDDERRALLAAVDYVIAGPLEPPLASTAGLKILPLSDSTMTIYEVSR